MNSDFWVTRDVICRWFFTCDFVTHENHWQIAPLVTQKSLFMVTHALFCIWEFFYGKWLLWALGPSSMSLNSFRPSDAIWRHRSRSTLAQVMACCLMAPNHYLNQCWLIISKVTKVSLKITYLRLNWNLPGANELRCLIIRSHKVWKSGSVNSEW